ncbi:hypothetical protein BH10ACT10_BH10ACT10_01140 [soil metagenome]
MSGDLRFVLNVEDGPGSGPRAGLNQVALRCTDVAEVASAAGFAHQEHLTQVMRARLDTTPGALRRSLR